jgi:amino acid transporter
VPGARLGRAGRDVPTAGGLYGIVARALGPRAGFLSLVLQLVTFVVVPSAFALAAGAYLAAVWPAVDARAAALVLLVAAVALAAAGIRFNVWLTAVLLGLELGAILLVSVLGLAHARWPAAGALLDPCRRRRGRRSRPGLPPTRGRRTLGPPRRPPVVVAEGVQDAG